MAVLKLFTCVLVLASVAVAQKDSFESTGIRVALKLYEDCSKADTFSPCLKKKAITFFDRLSRMDKLAITDGVVIVRDNNVVIPETTVTEEQLDSTLPRSGDAQDEQLNNMLFDKIARFISSRTLEVSMPKFSESELSVGEARKKMKGGGMMHGMMMGIAAKMAALIPIAIAGLFLLAGKALITAKIALLLSGIIAIKKLFGNKHGGGGGGGGWQSGGGGWQSAGGGGGWDKRSIDEAQKLAYKAYTPK